jgi:pimeloyl-ACP methyl ester carboxylesterase
MAVIKAGAVVLALLLLGTAALVVSARNGLLTPGEAALRARYSLPASRFLAVDGQEIHYADEGSGAAVILVHGSFGSLRNWNAWAGALAPDYRVIRFDRPRQGLSGPSPTGSYGVEEDIRLIRALARELAVEQFFLVATSSGGELAAAYAAAYPATVKGLVLANIAAGPLTMDTSHRPPLLKLLVQIDPVFGGWHPRLFWREIIRSNFAVPDRVTPAVVTEWTDLNNRAQRMPPRIFAPSDPVPFARTPADLARIPVPTLVLWSAQDAELPVETVGQAVLDLLGATDKELAIVPDCGHMLPLECGPQSARVARAFFARLAG